MKDMDPEPETNRPARWAESRQSRKPRMGKVNPSEPPAAKSPAAPGLPAPSIKPQSPDKAESARLLNTLLADEYVLYTKTLNYHWNVRGMQFHGLHAFFSDLYKQLLQICDDVAERVRTVGGTAFGTMQEFLKNARLKEQAGEPPDPRAMVGFLLADHEAILSSLRKDIETLEHKDDPGTCNFLTDLLEKHEKLAWMLRVHLDRELR